MTTQATGLRVLTGDTPTGNLHLGHWVGSVKRRVQMQDTHECYFLVANMHAFTTRADKADEIRRDCIEVARDALCMGIDPEAQRHVPADRGAGDCGAHVPLLDAPALQQGDAEPDPQG